MFYLVHYRNRNDKLTKMQIRADNEDEAQEKFVEYFEDEDLPVPEIISLVKG